MKQKTVFKLMDEIGNLFDTMTNEELTTWNFFVRVNQIVSNQKGIDCIMNMNFANGHITQGICVITDWEPGALVLQSDDGDLPKLRVVFPQEYIDFMREMQPILEAKYPAFPEDQDDIED